MDTQNHTGYLFTTSSDGGGRASFLKSSAVAAQRRDTGEVRILVCTKADLPSLIAMNRLLPALAERHDVEVLLTERVRPAERHLPDLSILKLLERDLPLSVLLPLAEAVAPAGPGLRSFERLGRELAIELGTIRRINGGDGFERATCFRPDLVLSIRFSLVFRQPMLDLPRHGILNLHPGPLPGFGGLFAIFRQMRLGLPEIGVTLHRVDAGIDTGPVVTVQPMPIVCGQSMLWHVLRAYEAGVPAMLAAVARLAAGEPLRAEPQDPARMSYFGLPEPDEFAAFAEAGLRLYDVEEYALDLRRLLGLAADQRVDELVAAALPVEAAGRARLAAEG
jgi:methionyl-tRNA formyltransferase